jgi:diguanylate cyclase (GGDEF)-like protein
VWITLGCGATASAGWLLSQPAPGVSDDATWWIALPLVVMLSIGTVGPWWHDAELKATAHTTAAEPFAVALAATAGPRVALMAWLAAEVVQKALGRYDTAPVSWHLSAAAIFASVLQLAVGWAVWLLVAPTAAGGLAAVALAVVAAVAVSYVTTFTLAISLRLASVADLVNEARPSLIGQLISLPAFGALAVLAHEHHPAAVFLLLGPVSATWYAALHGDERLALQERVDIDALTGLGGRERLWQRLDAEVLRSARDGTPVAVLVIDIDDFKRLNDTLGHLVGDECLVGVCEALRATLRATDEPFRYGGEEFVVVLPGTTTDGASRAAERIRRPPGATAPHRITVSIGAAVYGITPARAAGSSRPRTRRCTRRSGRARIRCASPRRHDQAGIGLTHAERLTQGNARPRSRA